MCEFVPDAPRPGRGGGGAGGGGGREARDPLSEPPAPPQPTASADEAGAPPAPRPPEETEVSIPAASFTLHPSEALTERLGLRPLAPGWLRVTGVAWVVEGGAEGRAAFDIKGRHRKRPKGDRCARGLGKRGSGAAAPARSAAPALQPFLQRTRRLSMLPAPHCPRALPLPIPQAEPAQALPAPPPPPLPRAPRHAAPLRLPRRLAAPRLLRRAAAAAGDNHQRRPPAGARTAARGGGRRRRRARGRRRRGWKRRRRGADAGAGWVAAWGGAGRGGAPVQAEVRAAHSAGQRAHARRRPRPLPPSTHPLPPGAPPESLEPYARRCKDGRGALLFAVPLPGAGRGGDDEGELAPGQSTTAVLWLHAPAAPGPWEFDCVWYCEPVVGWRRGLWGEQGLQPGEGLGRWAHVAVEPAATWREPALTTAATARPPAPNPAGRGAAADALPQPANVALPRRRAAPRCRAGRCAGGQRHAVLHAAA
jgi:hypothetical protein